MNYLEKWAESLVSSRSLPLNRTVQVEGIRKAHLGPRMDFAKVSFSVEPADDFNVVIQVPDVGANVERQRFVEWAIYGFLDVAMMTEPYPTKGIMLTVTGAEFDPVSSSMVAFRLAGRDAGRKFIEELRLATRPRT